MKDDLLPLIAKPSQYINHEVNSIHKNLAKVKTKVALVFPDLYEIGMSHLGLKILYNILNKRSDVAAERVYSPWIDLDELMRQKNIPLNSLESNIPISKFDIVGFTLQYELSYTNILNILSLGQIPLETKKRDNNYPLIIGGGPAAFNPEPLADFFDAFVLGDGEEVILDIVDIFQAWKDSKGNKDDLLTELAKIEGVYIPSFFEVSYLPSGSIKKILPLKGNSYQTVKKRVVKDLDKADFPEQVIIPFTKTIHDRVNIEIARGCMRGCRFCQAGIIYRPYRERSWNNIKQLIAKSLKNTGYEELSLTSLSVGDYSCLDSILSEIMKEYAEGKISVSLPSMHPETLTPQIIDQIKKVRKTGFTIVPEAGTQRLRNVINKGVTEDILLKTVSEVFKAGWDSIKLYFMIGLPTETEDDIKGIVRLAKDVLSTARKNGKRIKNITISISSFVPKPHTPFQWVSQLEMEELRKKQIFLQNEIRHTKLNIKWHKPELSFLEGVMARGDRRLGKVIKRAWELGSKFDGWSEQFKFENWQKAFSDCGIDPHFYNNRERNIEEVLPWDHFQIGISKKFLVNEYRKALKGETTIARRKRSDKSATEISLSPIHHKLVPMIKERFRFRVKFYKKGEMRFLSHLELVKTFARAVQRAEIPINYTQGFHPNPKIAFGLAMPVGMQSETEYADLEIGKVIEPNNLINRLNSTLPDGLKITDCKQISLKSKSLSVILNTIQYSIRTKVDLEDEPKKQYYQGIIDRFLNQEKILIKKSTKKGETKIDIKPLLIKLKLISFNKNNLDLEMILRVNSRGSIRPLNILKELYQTEDVGNLKITRIGLFHDNGKEWLEPLMVTN